MKDKDVGQRKVCAQNAGVDFEKQRRGLDFP
jgi:hypothetical protein